VQRDLARSQAAGKGDRAAGQQRPGASGDRAAAQKPSAGSRDRAAAPQRSGSRSPSSLDRGRGSGAYQGVGHGKQVRQDSSRGRSSRASAGSMGAHRGGGSRGGGGGARRR
jgi:hypothetical protein